MTNQAPSQSSAMHAVLRHLILGALAALVLAPFLWMLLLSVQPSAPLDPSSGLAGFFTYWLGNYHEALASVPMARFMANGVFVASAVLILQIAVAAPCAYALAKLDFPGRSALFALVLVALLIPQEVLGLPLFILFHYAGLLDSYAALILPFAVSPFAIFLLRQVFKTVPDDLIHAARLDGMSEIAIVWRVMLPSVVPTVIAFAILSFIARWNNLFWPLIAVNSQELMPPAMGIVFFRDEEAGNLIGPLMAASVMVVAPLVIGFLLAQRRFVESFQGGLK